MLRLSCLAVAVLLSQSLKTQVSGVLNVPTTYTSLASVINLLNTQGTSGPVTVAIAAGYTETAPVGGYSLYASGTSVSPIVFQKNGVGANPLITAFSAGNKTPGSSIQDGIWRLMGCDYITINGVDLYDPNIANPQTMEFGYGLFKLNAGDGCQFNVIKNCVITLNKLNNAAGSGPAADGSRGIEMVNATASAHTISLLIGSVVGSNSNNKFYSNTIRNCNIGISLNGFPDSSPFTFADSNNDLGGNSQLSGNVIVNFGGGNSGNAAAAIKTFSQYDLNVSFNLINNNTGSGINHPGTLRGIYINTALSANCTISNNTLTISGGGTNSQVSAIENNSGSTPASNSIIINHNHIINSNYSSAVTGSFYGIINSGSPANLLITNNTFTNNSTSATGGGNYLIYNNGAVGSLISISGNSLSFTYNGPSSHAGVLYNIYNSAGNSAASLSITGNSFSDYRHINFPGTAPIYFIYNTADLSGLLLQSNRWDGLVMHHSGPEYFIYNASSTQSVLTVNNNSLTNYLRTASSSNLYFYYGAATSPGTAVHTFTGNLISDLNSNVSGTGNFYGIYDSEGGVSPYPLKTVFNNTVSNVSMNGTGQFYGFFFTDLGDGGTAMNSEIYNNLVNNISVSDNAYGIYTSSPISPNIAARVHHNTISDLRSNGGNSVVYGSYLGSNNAGMHYSRNKICKVVATGSTSIVHGLYVVNSSTTNIINNTIGHLNTPFSGGTNRCNGIYINSGSGLNVFYNTIYLDGSSSGTNFGSNALFASSTATLFLKNNIFINLSIPTGTGISTAYRRSSSTISTYSTLSNNNIFYAGNPGPNNTIFHNGTTAYQTLLAFQTALAPRESLSQSQNTSFLSLSGSSPNYLHVTPNFSTSAESGAINMGGITDDYDSETRQGNSGYTGTGTSPDIGADEFELNLNPCSGAYAGTIAPSSLSVCAGQTLSLLATGYTPGLGILHQWKVSNSSTGPFINVSGGSGAGTPEYYTGALSSGTFYFVLQTTCTNVSLSAISNQATVLVNPIPSISVFASPTLACSGQNVILNANSNSGANYLWLGPAGYYSRQQNPTILPLGSNASGIYSVQARLNNCVSNTGTVSVSLSEINIMLVTSDPIICSGSSATLMAIGSASGYTWSNGATTSSIIVSPSVTTIYSISVSNTANCLAYKNSTISVLNPSISANGALNCGSVGSSTLSVNTFSPSQVSWFSVPGSTVPVGTGNSFTLNSSTSTTYYAQSKALLPGNLFTTINGTSFYQATMFDIVASNTIEVNGFDINLTSSGTSTIEIWYRPGSFVGNTLSSTGWLLAGTGTLSGTNLNGLIAFPLNFTVPVNAGQTVAFCVTATTASLICSNSGSVGTAFASNADMQVLTGNAGTYFNVNVTSRSFNGVVRYTKAGCISPLIPVTLTVSVPPIIVAAANPATVCPGKSTILNASGGVSYNWVGLIGAASVTVSPNSAKTYTVIGTDAYGCQNTATIVVGTHPVPSIAITQTVGSVCPSSATSFTASGAATYTWNTGPNGPVVTVTPATNSTYTVFGSSIQGCLSSNTVAVSTKSVPVIFISPAGATVCPGEKVSFTAIGAAGYTWYPGGIVSSSYTISPMVPSVCNVVGQSANSCTNSAFAIVYTDICAQLRGVEVKSARFTIYPNPSSGSVILYSDLGSDVEFIITNSLGLPVRRGLLTMTGQELDLSSLPKGVYFVHLPVGERSPVLKMILQ